MNKIEKAKKCNGIIRKLDELGRVVVPIEMRKELNISEGQKLNVFIRGKNIVLRINTEQEDGMLATIDELGRILIFNKIREKANIEVGQEVNIYTGENEIILQKRLILQ